MDNRQGKCSSCGAEYQVPASFTHDQARCKVCGGVVDFTAAASGQGAPAGGEAPKKKGGTLARLKAERARQAATSGAAAAKPAAATPPAARPPAARPPAARPPAARPAAQPTAVRPAAARAKAPTEDDDEQAATPRSRAGGRSKAGARAGGSRSAGRRRSGGASRRRRGGEDDDEEGGETRGRRGKKKGPSPILIGVGVLVVLAGGFGAFMMMGDGETQAAEDAAMADATGEPPADAAVAPAAGGPGAGDEGAADQGSETDPEAQPDPEEGADEAATAAGGGGDTAPAKSTKDPDSVDLSWIDFGPAPGTSAEDFADMTASMTAFMDLDAGAAGMRAGRKLEERGREAFPVVLNAMRDLDYSTEDGNRLGDMSQKTLEHICNGTNFGWRYTTEPNDVYFNKRVVESWSRQWEKAEDNVEYWIKMIKLDDKDPAEAKRLRSQFGDGSDMGGETEVSDDELDDLDVD